MTMSVALYPTRAALTGETASRPTPPAKRLVMGPQGAWKYPGLKRSKGMILLAFVISVGLHLLLIVGFSYREKPVPVVVAEEVPEIRLELPPIPVEEEPMPEEFGGEAEEVTGVFVPTLADIPTRVPLATDFVQTMQMHVPVDTVNLAADLSRVPVRIAHKPVGAGLKDLFDLAQLDRVPEPIAQPPPVFPFEQRSQVTQAEVVVEFIVLSDGRVQYATIVSATHAGFERAATEGVSRWRFRPGMKSGRKVNTRMRVPLIFTVVDE
jgi:periplasmic protein TonB